MKRSRTVTLSLVGLMLVVLIGGRGALHTAAQDGGFTPQPPTPVGPLQVYRSEPPMIIAGQSNFVSVFGANFTNESVVRLVGFSFVDTTFLNNTALRASIPEGIPPGQYGVEVSGPNGVAMSPYPLLIVAPTPTAQPTSTPTPLPTPTLEPTPLPGQPALVISDFVADPAVVAPGGSVRLNFQVVNQGNRTAQGVSVSVGADGKFLPAPGQAAVTVPDIPPGGSAPVTLEVVAALDAPSGPASIPVAFGFRDFEKTYTSQGVLGVRVERIAEVSQITLASYRVSPTPASPGETVRISVTVTNTGNQIARQVLIRVAGADSVLLAGPEGDTFPLGDIRPGERASRMLELVVDPDAQAGPRAQPVTLTYLQDAEAKESTDSLTINVARKVTLQPTLLLQSYDTGREALAPGDRFTLQVTFLNVGDDTARGTLLTFGTVEESGPPPQATPNPGGDSGAGGGSSSTTPSDTFAPIGSGGTLLIGDIAPDDTKVVTQEFIVNGRANSGLYSLPLTLNYKRSDGASGQTVLRISLPVVAPPQLRFQAQNPVPPQTNMGEPLPLAIGVFNDGTTRVDLKRAVVTADNGEVVDGAETTLSALAGGEDTTVNATVIPSGEGPVRITLTLYYADDLRQQRSLTTAYETEAVPPPPPPDVVEQPTEPTPEPTPSSQETLRRLILGLLGLGS
ncbi:MAG: hypothetical protein IT323_02515 [Anaerolineae bacterium]|nr:hypothetical protein [Anaerolineae bacterium]